MSIGHDGSVTQPRIDVVGLGPAGPELITAQTAALIEAVPHRFVRTLQHPAATAARATSFDHHYESHETFGEVYQAIVEDLRSAAHTFGHVLYAVPGSPRVAEHTVELLAEATDVDVIVHPALSFLDLSWVALGVDPIDAGVRVVDGHVFGVQAAGECGPLLIAQCHSADVLSEIKLAVGESAMSPVTVLQGLGTADERVFDVEWNDLDRVVEADHLTSVYVPRLSEPVAPAFAQFDVLVRRLRADCPWDADQTHSSLRRYLLEESYETLEALDLLSKAIDADDERVGERYADLEEELGDLLYQIFFHALLATEQGWFTVADVAAGIHDKLFERHPHVFGGDKVTLDELPAQWEAAKRAEKNRASVMDGIPAALPALLYATKVQKKAAAIGAFAIAVDRAQACEALRASTQRCADGQAALGELLFDAVSLAACMGIDAESVLREHAVAFADTVRNAEAT